MPLVVVDPRRRPPEDVLSVGAANFQGAGSKATAHLLALGHRRIATITGVPEQDNALAPPRGLPRRAHPAGGRAGRRRPQLRLSTYGVAAGYEETQRLLALDDAPTAILACSDDTALGALRALREAGRSVPDNVSLVGFDAASRRALDRPPARQRSRQPLGRDGRLAVALVHRARSASGRSLRTELATSLVLRASTAVPRA